MAIRGRSILAIVVFVMLGGVVAVGSWYETQRAKQPAPAMGRVVYDARDKCRRSRAGHVARSDISDRRCNGTHQHLDRGPDDQTRDGIPAFVNSHEVRVVGQAPGVQIDARA